MLQLETVKGRAGMYGRQTSVGAHNQIRSQTEDPTAAAIAVEVIAEEAEVFRQFETKFTEHRRRAR